MQFTKAQRNAISFRDGILEFLIEEHGKLELIGRVFLIKDEALNLSKTLGMYALSESTA